MDKQMVMGVVEYLVEQMQCVGKTQLQKGAYFLQESMGIPLGLDFEMYLYGPYAREIDHILTEMAAQGDVSICYYPMKDWVGYEIKAIKKSNREKVNPNYIQKIDELVGFLKPLDAKTTELCATIHFVTTILKDRGQITNQEVIAQEVKALKPKFSFEEINLYFDSLKNRGLLKVDNHS